MRGAEVLLFARVAEGSGVARGVDLDVVLADPDGIAIVQRGALYAEVIYESTVQAGQVFDNEAARFDVHARVIVRYRQVIDRQIVVG